MTQTMQAAFHERLGNARDVLCLGPQPMPVPQPDEVRVRIRWSGINPSDVKSRAGLRGRAMNFPRVIPHSDGMGVIDAVGAGVDASRLGQRVWVMNAAWGRPCGTAAQYTCVPTSLAVPLLPDTPDEVGACLGIPAMTALHAVLMDGGVAGRTVLVAGGAGAVGHYAIQFARRFGAHMVIATVSGDAKARLAAEAGAHAVIDYRQEDVVGRVRELTGGGGVDRVIEVNFTANLGIDVEVLRTAGDCVAYGSAGQQLDLPFPTLLAKNLQLKFFMVYHLSDADRSRAIEQLTRMLEAGEVLHNIACCRPLAEIVDAHESVERGDVVGKVLLRVD